MHAQGEIPRPGPALWSEQCVPTKLWRVNHGASAVHPECVGCPQDGEALTLWLPGVDPVSRP